jgi:hypothetical protein
MLYWLVPFSNRILQNMQIRYVLVSQYCSQVLSYKHCSFYYIYWNLLLALTEFLLSVTDIHDPI